MPDGSVLPHAETAMSLLGASPKIAAKKADAIVKTLGFPNPYTLSKHLAEDLVAELHTQGRLNACIVRPSIVGANAGGPAPGKKRRSFFPFFYFDNTFCCLRFQRYFRVHLLRFGSPPARFETLYRSSEKKNKKKNKLTNFEIHL